MLLAVLFLFAVNLFFFSGRFHSIDEMALLSTTESIVKWQRADINALAWGNWLLRGPDQQGLFNAQGDLYAKKAPLVAWLAVPIYALAGLARFGQVQAALLLNALIVALTGGVVFRFATRLGYTTCVAVWAALLLGLGTSALVYAKYLFSEPVAGLGFLLAAEAVWRARNEGAAGGHTLALGGVGLGAAVLTNPVNAVFVPIFFVALVVPFRAGSLRSVVRLLWPLALALAVMAIWNAARFGNPFVAGYHFESGEGFTSPLRISLPGMLFSPARGLVWFVPATLLALAGLASFARRHTRLAAVSLVLIAGHVLVFSAWWMWWGGWGWGPRFLVPIMPFVVLSALPVLEAARRRITVRALVVVVFSASVAVQVLGASVGFDEYEDIMTKTHLRGDPEGDLYTYGLDMLWSWPHSPLVGHADLLRKGNTDLAWLPSGQVDWFVLIPLVALVATTGVALYFSHRKSAGNAGTICNILCALCAFAVILVLWRAGLHPLGASYGLDPLEGRSALDFITSRAQPGDGVLLVRFLSTTEMDRFPRFPPVYGIPDDALFGAEWNADLERLADNAQTRQRRLWLIVKSEDDSFAAHMAAWLKPRWRRTERAQAGGYAVVLFEPR
jgi:4-amino-4-deoxy-L-arabinose transferase-like glycosyltransferase